MPSPAIPASREGTLREGTLTDVLPQTCEVAFQGVPPPSVPAAFDGSFREVPQERSFVSSSATFQQILDSMKRQESAILHLTENHGLLHSTVRQYTDALCERLDSLQDNGTWVPTKAGSTPMAAGCGTGGKKDKDIIQRGDSDLSSAGVLNQEPEPETKDTKQPAVSPMNVVAIAKAVRKDHAEKEESQKHHHSQAGEVANMFAHQVKAYVSSTAFELIMSCVISFNMIILATHLQCEGRYAAQQLGLRDDDGGWSQAKGYFEVLEKMFNAVYLVELMVRVWAFRREYFHHALNVADGLIVMITCVDSFIVRPLESGMGGLNFAALRIFRICRIFRMQKVLQYSEHMSEMRILVETLMLSLQGLFWSALLIMVVIMSAAIVMVQLSLTFLSNDSIPLERRQWLSNMFGTTSKAFYSMFECTFSSGWGFYTRPMIEEVSLGFALFWGVYIVCINFAMIRVIAAIFLKQIMFVACLDEKRIAMEKEKERASVATELQKMFAIADSSKNGAISRHEFDKMLQDPHVLIYLDKMGLEIEDAVALFSLMALDDGEADYAEFMEGALNQKSQARFIDVVQVLHRQVEMHNELASMTETLQTLRRQLR